MYDSEFYSWKEAFAAAWKSPTRPCFRCNELGHDMIKCDTKFRKCWKAGKSKFSGTAAAEAHYEDKMNKTQPARVQKAPLQPDPASNKKLLKPHTITSPATASGTTKAPASQAKRAQAPQATFDFKHMTIKQDAQGPRLQRDGIYKTETEHLGPATSRGQIRIMANYVKVNQVPNKLYVYSLRFWRPHPKNANTTMEFNKKREIAGAFEAFLKSGHLNISTSSKDWATNFKDLWRSSPLPIHGQCGCDTLWETESPTFTYTQLNGERVLDMRATVKYQGLLSDVDVSLRTKHITDLGDCIRALNAHVAQSARDNDNANKLTQVGANKFFMNGGYDDMRGLFAVRGYYTSIGPASGGALLNINTATSTFLPPVAVSAFLRMHRMAYAEKMLQGATVRLAYNRVKRPNGVDPNTEEARRKTFRQFGLVATKQRFFTVIPKNKEDSKSQKTRRRTRSRSNCDRIFSDRYVLCSQALNDTSNY
jgi:hypothetical protein